MLPSEEVPSLIYELSQPIPSSGLKSRWPLPFADDPRIMFASFTLALEAITVPAAGGGETMVALVLADAYRRKFGGYHVDDVRQAVCAYGEQID